MVNRFYQQSETNLALLGCGTDIIFNVGSDYFKELQVLIKEISGYDLALWIGEQSRCRVEIKCRNH